MPNQGTPSTLSVAQGAANVQKLVGANTGLKKKYFVQFCMKNILVHFSIFQNFFLSIRHAERLAYWKSLEANLNRSKLSETKLREQIRVYEEKTSQQQTSTQNFYEELLHLRRCGGKVWAVLRLELRPGNTPVENTPEVKVLTKSGSYQVKCLVLNSTNFQSKINLIDVLEIQIGINVNGKMLYTTKMNLN